MSQAVREPSAIRSLSGLREQFLGTWALDRRSRKDGARFEGSATFSAEHDGTLLYVETGRLFLPTMPQPLPATRRYLYAVEDDRITIRFADGMTKGNVFVELSFPSWPQTRVADAVHHCGDDLYRVRYSLDLQHGFDVSIDVTGPRKDYELLSRYRRMTE